MDGLERSTKNCTSRVTSVWTHLVLLVMVCAVLYSRHLHYLFEDYDAHTLLVLFKSYFQWAAGTSLGQWNPLQGLGTHFFFNGHAIPALYIFAFPYEIATQKIVCFIVLTVQMFLGCHALLRALGAERGQAIAGAWAGVLGVFPLHFQPVPLGQIYAVYPLLSHCVSLAMLLLALFLRIGRQRGSAVFGEAFCFAVLAWLLAVSSVAAMPVTLPLLGMGGLFALIAAEDWRERYWKLAAVLLALGVLWLSGALPWLAGQVLFSARASLTEELLDSPPALHFVSVFFYTIVASKLLIPLGLVGGVLLARNPNRTQRYAGSGYLAYYTIFALTAALYMTPGVDMRRALRPIYIEYAFLPYTAMSSAYAVYILGGFLARWLPARLVRVNWRTWVVPGILLYVALMSISTFWLKKYRPEPQLQQTAVTRELEKNIALKPGDVFRGRSVSLLFYEARTPEELRAEPLPVLNQSAQGWGPLFANSHMEWNLWASAIPTLDCYEQTMTIPYYVLLSRLASHSPWGINQTYISRLEPALFAALGVRYVVTSRQVSMPGLRLSAVATDSWQGSVPKDAVSQKYDHEGFFLYELSAPNVGNYSPVRIRQAETLDEALRIMAGPGFDYRYDAVLTEPLVLKDALTPVDNASMRMERGGVRIEAVSSGTTLLLLPIAYAHSMRWTPDADSPDSAKVRILRADVALTGLLFHGRAKGLLTAGIPAAFAWSTRLDDYDDMLHLGLRSLPRRNRAGKNAFITAVGK